MTRSHVYLLEAIDRLLARDPGLRDRLEVHLAGVLSEVDREVAARSPVTVLHGYLSHADSIALMRSADLLFLPMQDLPPGRRSSTVPGKTYEYLAAGRPILGAVPEGDTRDILKRAGHSVCGPGDTEAIADAISVAARTLGDDAVLPHDYWEVVHRFERRELARRLVEVVEQVVPVEALRRERRADRIAVVD